jgi:hypothetical protein
MNYVQFFSYFSVAVVNRGLVIGLLRVGEMLPLFHIRSFGNYEFEMVTRDSLTYRRLANVTNLLVCSSYEQYTSQTNLGATVEYNMVLK